MPASSEMTSRMQLLLVSGLSGSGKGVAMRVLEDAGFYCVDNLPAALLEDTLQVLAGNGDYRVAISMDGRTRDAWRELPTLIERLREQMDVRLLFLEAKTETLVRRYSETRRRHPFGSQQRALAEAISWERDLLEPIARLGNRMDTSEIPASTLQHWVKDFIALEPAGLTLQFTSFGFKRGIPLDADLVFDVRCLPNPHYDPRLRDLTGRDQPVIEFLQRSEEVGEMLTDIQRHVEKWLPCFVRDHRSYLTVAIGCTGGQHRSVYLCEQLAGRLADRAQIQLRHRELGG